MKADDLIEKWKIEREVCDPLGGVKQSMCGFGYFHPLKKHELLYQEQLWHETENQDLFFATKSYRYVFKKKEIQIYFHQEEDNRLFITLPIGKEMSGTSTCKEDRYRLQWDWINSDIFLMRYIVKGTKKDYIIESEFKK